MNPISSPSCVLLTGSTGFLGAQVARRLLRNPEVTVIALVRAESQSAAATRLSRAWWDWPDLISALQAGQVEPLQGDVSLPYLGLDEVSYTCLANHITHIIHSAADLQIDAPIEELRKTNFQGTLNLLELARLAHRLHGIERYVHISTAYVAGMRSGSIPESDLTDEYGFSNAYEQSKYEAECLVQFARSELPVSVFRPGMIVGSSDTGEIRTFNTLYYPLRLYLAGKLRLVPADPNLPLNIIPVDYVAETISRLAFCPQAKGQTFHLVAPSESLPKLGELLDFVRSWAQENLGVNLPKPVYVRLPLPQPEYHPARKGSGQMFRTFQASLKSISPELGGLSTLLPYFNDRKRFERQNVDRLLGPYSLDWRAYLPRLLAYAVSQGFMHRTERTVHEQLLARLDSKSRPVNYYDIVQGKRIHRTAADLKQEILSIVKSLVALGIQPGDRVAIVGLNSTRYLALDAGIGLIGAVSVPVYYTSPPTEVDHILSASGARLLFVSAPKIFERMDEIQANLPVLSFSRQPLSPHLLREVISWESFLSMGVGQSVNLHSPVRFDDLATLRYTSGTTGYPKGVSFQHQHLRWMAQMMASLLPWQSRWKTADYLSFLPMNHVTEGILAMYSPYYLPAPVNIYFLEEFKALQRTLPKIKPTIFFSVPRIYEKIWEALELNPVGARYLALPGGFLKRVLGSLLRRQTLRKAGLNRCTQLLSGSAPCSPVLLHNFRQLGVEIYNAYGLTEAPLITMNRVGANRLGTVGEPLPQTQVRIAEDGEVLVRGPQVMAGYFEGSFTQEARQPFLDGWLLTGDLGYLSPEGSLVINGRKKELFKNSYGKYVQPGKVESLLRGIPGVSEAMLVGDQQPYCVALLWVDGKDLDSEAEKRIDRLVTQVNQDLSNPEQVKRWAVLPNDLSIEKGDLTANLKLKRQAISRRLDGVLNSLYQGIRPSNRVMHMGVAGRA